MTLPVAIRNNPAYGSILNNPKFKKLLTALKTQNTALRDKVRELLKGKSSAEILSLLSSLSGKSGDGLLQAIISKLSPDQGTARVTVGVLALERNGSGEIYAHINGEKLKVTGRLKKWIDNQMRLKGSGDGRVTVKELKRAATVITTFMANYGFSLEKAFSMYNNPAVVMVERDQGAVAAARLALVKRLGGDEKEFNSTGEVKTALKGCPKTVINDVAGSCGSSPTASVVAQHIMRQVLTNESLTASTVLGWFSVKNPQPPAVRDISRAIVPRVRVSTSPPTVTPPITRGPVLRPGNSGPGPLRTLTDLPPDIGNIPYSSPTPTIVRRPDPTPKPAVPVVELVRPYTPPEPIIVEEPPVVRRPVSPPRPAEPPRPIAPARPVTPTPPVITSGTKRSIADLRRQFVRLYGDRTLPRAVRNRIRSTYLSAVRGIGGLETEAQGAEALRTLTVSYKNQLVIIRREKIKIKTIAVRRSVAREISRIRSRVRGLLRRRATRFNGYRRLLSAQLAKAANALKAANRANTPELASRELNIACEAYLEIGRIEDRIATYAKRLATLKRSAGTLLKRVRTLLRGRIRIAKRNKYSVGTNKLSRYSSRLTVLLGSIRRESETAGLDALITELQKIETQVEAERTQAPPSEGTAPRPSLPTLIPTNLQQLKAVAQGLQVATQYVIKTDIPLLEKSLRLLGEQPNSPLLQSLTRIRSQNSELDSYVGIVAGRTSFSFHHAKLLMTGDPYESSEWGRKSGLVKVKDLRARINKIYSAVMTRTRALVKKQSAAAVSLAKSKIRFATRTQGRQKNALRRLMKLAKTLAGGMASETSIARLVSNAEKLAGVLAKIKATHTGPVVPVLEVVSRSRKTISVRKLVSVFVKRKIVKIKRLWRNGVQTVINIRIRMNSDNSFVVVVKNQDNNNSELAGAIRNYIRTALPIYARGYRSISGRNQEANISIRFRR
ncbi:MAG: hypothetical protein U9R38_04915 [Candidatus Margulisiibacteriota bacterium]|nr:hypothetical protein [Candidatus Margulisiibacteriota bacterium]